MSCVIVTGAAGSIGRALVHRFTEAGYGVIATDVAEQPHDLVCENFITCDLQRLARCEELGAEVFGAVREALRERPLAGLINNAAIQIVSPVEALNRETWAATLEVNLVAPFLWVQAFLPELEASGGMVLNISSIHARLTKPKFVAYATSKAALSGMSRAMAVELGARVRVNAIEPAAIDSNMLRTGLADPAAYEKLVDHHPSCTIGTPAGLADLAQRILEMPGAFTNGMIAEYDGGISSRLHDPSGQ